MSHHTHGTDHGGSSVPVTESPGPGAPAASAASAIPADSSTPKATSNASAEVPASASTSASAAAQNPQSSQPIPNLDSKLQHKNHLARPGGASGNKFNLNHRKSYSNGGHQKVPGFQQQQSPYGYGYPMASYGYMPPYSMMAPNMGPPPNYTGQKPFSSPYSLSPKIKLTTKDGKPVDLEEKKRLLASHAPIHSSHIQQPQPAQLVGSAPAPVPAAQPAAPGPTQTPPQVSQAPKEAKKAATNSATEEFMRKVRERAQARLAEKNKLNADTAVKKEDSAPVEEITEVKPVTEKVAEPVTEKAAEPVIDKVAEPVSEEASEPVTEKAAEPVSEMVTEPATEKDAEPVTEKDAEPVTEKDAEPVTEKVDEPITEKVAEPITEKVVEPITEKVVEPITENDAEPAAETSKSELASTTSESTVSAAEPTPASTENSAEPSERRQETETGEGENNEEDDAEPEPTFTISHFLAKLKEATDIEDLASVKYPEGIQGVDTSKQLASIKYRYDPQFLIQFKDVVSFKVDEDFKTALGSHVDIFTAAKKAASLAQRSMSKPNGLPNRFSGMLNRGSQFGGDRQNSRNGSKRRGQPSGDRLSRDRLTRKGHSKRSFRDGGSREEEEDPAANYVPPEDVKPLEKLAKRWVPKSLSKPTAEVRYNEDGLAIIEPADVITKVNSLLNKLTLEMFNQITDQMLEVAHQAKFEEDAATIKQIISLTFAKACDEPYWSEMYAKFCAKLCMEIPADVCDKTVADRNGEHSSGGVLARRLLLTTCQTEYEKGWTDKLPTNEDGLPLEPEMMSDEYYIMAAAKRRGLGLVKFIGYLYNLGMLNDQVIYVCLRDQAKNVVDPSDDSLENLAQLVKTVGPKLDSEERKRAILKLVFDYVSKVLESVKLTSRIKYMLMDLQDLRRAKWQSNKQDAGPKTIEEIHRDAEIKRIEEMRATNDKKMNRRHNDSRSNSSRGGSSWNNSGGGSGGMGGMKKSPSFASARQLHFGDRHSSNAGSNYGAGGASNTTTALDASLQRELSKRLESQQTNMFAALNDDE